MEAQELRIGNYVNYQGIVQKIHSLNMNEVRLGELAFDDFSHRVENSIPKPIPLTEEWLVNFGWVEGEYDGQYVYEISLKFGVLILIYELDVEIFFIEWCSEVLEIEEIKYVHQFQNLCYELTKKEMTITNNN